jgi:electron transfer flavoprotein alpha subunit
VRTAAFPAAGEGDSAAIEAVTALENPGLSTFKGEEIAKSDRPELASALTATGTALATFGRAAIGRSYRLRESDPSSSGGH